MEHATFAAAINCIDGRVQTPVREWMKQHLHVHYVDRITEPGPDRVLSEGPAVVVESIRQKVMVSITAHHAGVIAIVGHHDCAGNPVPKGEHLDQIRKCVAIIASWGFAIRILGLWVNERWEVEVVHDTARHDFA